MSWSVAELLADQGGVARQLGTNFEARPEQVEMALRVERTLAERSKLLVEAGTGVGKSFAYLLPAIARIAEHGERVVVATNTIALQEQLIAKDIPLMERVFPGEDGRPVFRAELVKGRGNYLSLRRLEMASRRQDRLFAEEAYRRSLHVIEDWAYDTADGSLSTLPPIERPAVWDAVQSDSGNCMGRKCPRYDKCFYQSARRRMERADLLICNHALFFSDLAMRSRGVGFLPRYDHVILDEAHHVEDAASDHFGLSLSEGRVRHLLHTLYQPRRHKGYLDTLKVGDDAAATVERAVGLVLDAEAAADEFFDAVISLTSGRAGSARIGAHTDAVPRNGLTPAFKALSVSLRTLKELALVEEDRFELNSYAERAASIAEETEMLVEQQLDGCVYWAETRLTEGGKARGTLACSPIDVAPVLRANLFDAEKPISVVLTSATLATGGRAAREAGRGFEHVRDRLGCLTAEAVSLGSPFDHARQVELHVDTAMSDPRHPRYTADLADRILRHIRATDGGAFVLFTSFATMYDAADRLRPALEDLGMPVFVQGRDGSRMKILDGFREGDRSVLFGTSSFWQGVDVRGRGLRNVIITRLPFEPPDRPLTQARLEAIEARGGNGFMDDSLPRAILRFKQGFGRLIRSRSDRGRVVVLDPRIVTARYGRLFLDALPEGVPVIDARATAPHADEPAP
ncbi:MAG: helicase [Phycisphaerales bacterium]|nr:helicase [Phycisphaerales bacterium]